MGLGLLDRLLGALLGLGDGGERFRGRRCTSLLCVCLAGLAHLGGIVLRPLDDLGGFFLRGGDAVLGGALCLCDPVTDALLGLLSHPLGCLLCGRDDCGDSLRSGGSTPRRFSAVLAHCGIVGLDRRARSLVCVLGHGTDGRARRAAHSQDGNRR